MFINCKLQIYYSHIHYQFSSVQFSRSVMSDYLRHHELQQVRSPCPSATPGVHPNSCPSSRWYHTIISSSVVPFSSCPQSLPASESFPMSHLFTWGGQSTRVSALASFLPMNTQDWSPLGILASVQFSSVAQLCPILCDPMNASTPGLPVHHQLPEFTNLDSILKSRDITLPTKVHLVKAMVFPVVMYGCESWTVKKAECWKIDSFELWCWKWNDSWEFLGLQGEPTSPFWRSALGFLWKKWC